MNELPFGDCNFLRFFNRSFLMFEIPGTAVKPYKTKTFFSEELLKQGDFPILTEGGPFKRYVAAGSEDAFSNFYKGLNEEQRFKALEGEVGSVSGSKSRQVHLRPY